MKGARWRRKQQDEAEPALEPNQTPEVIVKSEPNIDPDGPPGPALVCPDCSGLIAMHGRGAPAESARAAHCSNCGATVGLPGAGR